MMKSLIQKLKTGLIGLSIIGASYFNYVQAQENYMPKYNTTTHYIIKEIQKEDAYINLKTLDRIIDQSKRIITKKNYSEQEAKNLIQKIDSEIIEKYPELDDSIQSCYFKSLTYLAIGETNNLPLYATIVPGHIFIRWDPDGKHNPLGVILNSRYIDPEDYSVNKGDFNWDPNSLNKFKTDKAYFFEGYLECGKEPFGYGEIRKGIYLKNLDKKELLSIAYQQEGAVLSDKKLYDLALKSLDKSIELNPNNHIAYYSKGSDLCNIGEEKCKEESDLIILNSIYDKYFKEAYECYKKSLDFIDFSRARSLIYFTLGKLGVNYLNKYEEAEYYLTKAVDDGEFFFSDELLKECFLERIKLYELTDQKEKKERDIEKIRNIDSRYIKNLSSYLSKTDLWEVYPEGVTELVFLEENKKVIERVVVNNKKTDIYIKIVFPWATFYKKNDIDISSSVWEVETKTK